MHAQLLGTSICDWMLDVVQVQLVAAAWCYRLKSALAAKPRRASLERGWTLPDDLENSMYPLGPCIVGLAVTSIVRLIHLCQACILPSVGDVCMLSSNGPHAYPSATNQLQVHPEAASTLMHVVNAVCLAWTMLLPALWWSAAVCEYSSREVLRWRWAEHNGGTYCGHGGSILRRVLRQVLDFPSPIIPDNPLLTSPMVLHCGTIAVLGVTACVHWAVAATTRSEG